MSRSYTSVAEVLERCEDLGCTVCKTKKGHFKVLIPDGGIVITASTPTDHRAIKNILAQLRRGGLKI